MADDYAPVISPEDEEEQRRRSSLGGYAPVTPAAPAPAAAPTPVPEPYPAVGPVPGVSAEPLSPRTPTLGDIPKVATPQRPQWKDYAPAEKHGAGRFGQVLGEMFTGTPQRTEARAVRNYGLASGGFDKEQADRLAAAKEQREAPLTAAQTHEAEARATALENPTEKVGTTPEAQTLHDLMTGENGGPRTNPQTGKPYSYIEAYQATKQAGQDVKPQKPDTPEQQFIDSETAKGIPLAKAIADYARVSQKPEKPGAEDQRGEHSYQATLNRVEKLRAPVEQRLERISRLEDTLNQNSPQADALIAPELLTVMAGGQGSGLRMNEAEIARIIGGRTQWESLKAKLNAWELDPSKPFALTPEQRQQTRALFTTIKDRVSKKAQAIDEESQALANSNNPQEHRQIYQRLQKSLLDIDTGAAGGQGGGGNEAPEGTRIQVGNQIQVKRNGKWVPEQQ